MGRGLGKIQKQILTVLEELTRRNKRDYFSLSFVTIYLYHPHRLDPLHERNVGRIAPFREDWSCGDNERRRIWESCRGLEARKMIEIRIIKEIRPTWGGCTRWMEVRLKERKI